MRRGGRGSSVQAPRRGHDDAIPSTLHLDRRWAARNYVQVMVLAACSIAISIIIWSLRPGLPRALHLLGHHIPSRNGGFVLPLYHYYRQFPNGSHIGGRERWRGSRVGFHGRGIRSEELKPLLELHGGHQLQDFEIEQFYIEMKLGDPPKPFHFHVDTGSRLMWVYCTDRGHASSIEHIGPHGLFVPEMDWYAKCTGATATLCRVLQARREPCDKSNNYKCQFSAKYVDGAKYVGLVVNGSITVLLRDEIESNVFGLFGCVLQKKVVSETLPLITDGLIGLGNCKGTLVDQLSTSKVISQNVLGVCLAKEIQWSMLPASPAFPVGFISLGIDFEEEFDRSNSVWAKLTDPGPRIHCAYAAKLLSISIDNGRIPVVLKFPDHETVGMAMIFDTGSDLLFLHQDVYDRVLQAIETYTTNKEYFRVVDNVKDYPASQQRVCWEYHGNKRQRSGNRLTKASPIRDFRPLKLGFEGIASTTESAPLKNLIIQPENYLTWDVRTRALRLYNEDERKVCVNIVQETSTISASMLGVQLMREHLFVFDIDNQRVRWKASSNCEV